MADSAVMVRKASTLVAAERARAIAFLKTLATAPGGGDQRDPR